MYKNAAALGRQLFEHHKQLFHRLRRQHRSGLVQDQQLGLVKQRADDLHPLHLAHAQRVHRTRRVDVQPVLLRLGRDAVRHFIERQALVQAQPDVFGHGERVEQAEMLEHHADAQARASCGLRMCTGWPLNITLPSSGLTEP
jgi:hypothetical protein